LLGKSLLLRLLICAPPLTHLCFRVEYLLGQLGQKIFGEWARLGCKGKGRQASKLQAGYVKANFSLRDVETAQSQ